MSPPAWKAGVVTEMEEAAFISRIVPIKIARANQVGFIGQPLAAYGCGQGNERASARPSDIATPMPDRARMVLSSLCAASDLTNDG
jgi:hypothetical protein